MAKTKFTINKESLLEGQEEGYILTRVPNSKMEYYLLLRESDIISSDENTLVAEWDSEQELRVIPRVTRADGQVSPPTLKEAIAKQQEPTGTIPMKAGDLYKEYYYYDESKDPNQREQEQRIRDQKRREALERSDNTKNMQQQAQGKQNDKTDKQSDRQQAQTRDNNTNAEQKKPLSPAQKMEQQRAEIKHYSKQQFKEILKGTRQGLDASFYRNINLSPQQMKELRLALKAGLDVSKYNSPFISAKHMKEIRIGAKRGVQFDMNKINHSLYNAAQIHEIRLGFEKKLDVKKYIDPAYDAAQMKEIRLGMQAGLDTGKFEDLHMTAEQMHSIRIHMVMENAENILKRMFEDIRSWLNEKIEDVNEILRSRYQNREPMTAEQIKDIRMDEAIEMTKDLFIQSELLPETAYDNKGLDEEMKRSAKEWQEYLEQHPEKQVQQAAKETVKDICETAGVEMEQLKDEKVIDIQQGKNKSIEQTADRVKKENVQPTEKKEQSQQGKKQAEEQTAGEAKKENVHSIDKTKQPKQDKGKSIEQAVDEAVEGAMQETELVEYKTETWEMIQ